MTGTVNISRDIWQDAAFKSEPFTEREAFMWLIMEASWKPREKRVGNITVKLERGQLAASVRFMADAWGWQKSTVDRFLKRLKNRDMIGTAGGTGVNVVTIRKYNEYQSAPKQGGTAKTPQAGRQRDSSGTNEKKGEIREDTEEEAYASLSSGDDAPADAPTKPKPFDEIARAVTAYNATAEASGWPTVRILSKARRSALAARLREAGGLAGWEAALSKAQASPHCCGENARGWTANFDFLTRQSSFAKLMEGNYDPRHRHDVRHASEHPQIRAIAAAARAF